MPTLPRLPLPSISPRAACLTLALGLTLGAPAPGVSVAVARPAASAPAPVLPFREGGFEPARAAAAKAGKLLVVDAWAPWCHTCLSMRNFVFTDARLSPVADRFVYVAIDTDTPEGATFVERYPIQAWPTLLVLDPRADKPADAVVARWLGAMTAEELLARLTPLATPAATAATRPRAEADLRAADVAASGKRWGEAAQLYQKVADDPQAAALRTRARLGQIQALRAAGQHRACVDLVGRVFVELGTSAAATDAASYAADCLEKVEDADARQRARQQLLRALVALVQDPNAQLATDDRSDGYGTAAELSDAIGDKTGGDRLTAARLALLEDAAARARTPAEAATFDAHRLDCYRRLKRYVPAEKMLLSSLRAFPKDYNPPARLALLYFDMGRLEDALRRVDEALALSYGPRRTRYLELKANILHGLGRTHSAVQALETEVLALESEHASPTQVAAVRQHITALLSTLQQLEPDTVAERPGPGPKKNRQVARRGP